MMNTSAALNWPNPWDFGNEVKQLISPDGANRVEYGELNEIAMGGPLVGDCYWVDSGGRKHLIEHGCGGPPVWNESGTQVAIPVWTRKFLGTVQQLIVVDVTTREAKRYRETFDVLDLRSFHEGILYGYDSPIHETKTVQFNIQTARTSAIQTI
jgi:ABC-type phosphate transport system auxiliary subunit